VVNFTGQSVRHADGSQLQRVGIVPDIEAHPTLRAIREGRDDVMERAIEFLSQGQKAALAVGNVVETSLPRGRMPRLRISRQGTTSSPAST
jgi:C-terminal processing protease CtpA/Prc